MRENVENVRTFLQIFATIRSSLNDYVYVSRLGSRMNHLKQFKDSNGRFKSG